MKKKKKNRKQRIMKKRTTKIYKSLINIYKIKIKNQNTTINTNIICNFLTKMEINMKKTNK